MDHQFLFPYKGFSDLFPVLYGYAQCESGYSYGPRARGFYLLHYITKGKGLFRNGKGTHSLHQGQLFLICPEETVFYQADRESPWSYTWLGFHGKTAQALVESTGLSGEHPIAEHAFLSPFFQELTEKMRRHAFPPGRRGELALLAVLYELFSLFPDSSVRGNRKEYYVSQVKNVIYLHYANQITVQRIADMMGLNRRYLCRVFKSQTGLTIQDYLADTRLENAANLLASTSLSIGEITHAVGYQDLFHFSKMFKKRYALSPTAYRKKVKSED